MRLGEDEVRKGKVLDTECYGNTVKHSRTIRQPGIDIQVLDVAFVENLRHDRPDDRGGA